MKKLVIGLVFVLMVGGGGVAMGQATPPVTETGSFNFSDGIESILRERGFDPVLEVPGEPLPIEIENMLRERGIDPQSQAYEFIANLVACIAAPVAVEVVKYFLNGLEAKRLRREVGNLVEAVNGLSERVNTLKASLGN